MANPQPARYWRYRIGGLAILAAVAAVPLFAGTAFVDPRCRHDMHVSDFTGKCKPLSADSWRCDGVILRAACLSYASSREGQPTTAAKEVPIRYTVRWPMNKQYVADGKELDRVLDRLRSEGIKDEDIEILVRVPGR